MVKPEELTKKITEAKTKFHSNYVSFTIPDELTYVFSTSIPIVLGRDATESVAFTIEENVPLSLEDTVFDFTPLAIKTTDTEPQAKVVVAACVKKEIEKIVELLRGADLEPLSCLPESQAIAEAIVPRNFLGTAYVVQARDNRVAIYLVRDGGVQFSTLRSIVKGDYAQEFLDEYNKFLEYCAKYDSGVDHVVNAIFVCGEFDYAKQTLEVLARIPACKGKVALANVWGNVFAVDEHTPELPYETSLSFAGSIGAAIAPI